MTSSETQSRNDAFAIHDDLLERTRAGYLSNDFDMFSACFRIPHIIESFEGQSEITSLAELRRMFDAMRAVFQDIGVIDMNRRTIEAQFVSPDRIDATFITEYIIGGYKVSEEVVGNSVIEKESNSWRVVRGRYATRISVVSRALLKK